MLTRAASRASTLRRACIAAASAVVCVVLPARVSAICSGGRSNGTLEPGEQCDGGAVRGLTCANFCGGGTLRCYSNCTFDLTGCQRCGDNAIEGTEVCDGTALGDAHCPVGGPLTCLPSCLGFNWSGCYRCGNGIREGSEACDGADVGGAACPPGSTSGQARCNSDCRLDYGACVRCGDGDQDAGEECDDGNTIGGDGCSGTCRLECGDGILQPRYEACDDGNRTNGDGCADVCLWERRYDGGGGEAADHCLLMWNVELAAGTPLGTTVSCREGGVPCDRGPAGDGTCAFLVDFCVNNSAFTSGVCAPTDVARVELEGASLTGPGALGPAEQTAVLDAFTTALGRWGGSGVGRSGPVLDASPPVRGQQCGEFLLPVPLNGQRTVAMRATDSAGVVDDDQITFTCTP
jgi:cysteine-rich repeat protein